MNLSDEAKSEERGLEVRMRVRDIEFKLRDRTSYHESMRAKQGVDLAGSVDAKWDVNEFRE